MKLIADSGSTKTDWWFEGTTEPTESLCTQGINPFHQDENTIQIILTEELMPQLKRCCALVNIDAIEFYGAGCTAEKSLILKQIIEKVLCKELTTESSNTAEEVTLPDITVASDLLGAAKALCKDKEGIACILGTGANSCLYDGEKIVQNVSPMGYILGDEGSGAVIGRTFLNELYKGGHSDFIATFERETGLTQADVIQKVYREPMANRFLASLSKHIAPHIDDEPWINDMLVECFRAFFRRNVAHYNRPDLAVSFVGSIAFHYKEQLREAANAEGYTIGTIIKAPKDIVITQL